MASMYKEVSEEVLIGAFINGLKEEIAVEIRMLRPQGLGNIMSLAQSVERRNEALKKVVMSSKGGRSMGWGSSPLQLSFSRIPSTYKGGNNAHKQEKLDLNSQPRGQEVGKVRSNVWPNNQKKPAIGFGAKGGTMRRLSEEEHRKCREQGLCFKCFEKYSPTHVCKQRQLNVLIVSEEGEEEDVGQEMQEEPSEQQTDSTFELSMKSIVGIADQHNTMKIKGLIGKREIVVLVDSGATHNFISNELVKEQNIRVEDSGNEFGVQVGDGVLVRGKGICRGVDVWMQNVEFKIDCYPFDLGSADMVLGVCWLQSLGDIKANWKTLSLTFHWNGRKHTLRGDPTLSKTLVSLKTMLKLLQQDNPGVLVELNSISLLQAEKSVEVHEEVGELLKEFEDIFEMPSGLPLKRDKEHSILLKQGTDPPNIRPYK